MNRALSIRSGGSKPSKGLGGASSGAKTSFSLSSLRGTVQPELSRKLFWLIKSENNLIKAHETAGRERISIAQKFSEWGEQTSDDAISGISDKVGVVLSELGEQEDTYAHALDESRGRLKSIRNTEKSVQPSCDGKSKVADKIAKIRLKEPESAKLVVLEQELVRAEAKNLVAEAQLTKRLRQGRRVGNVSLGVANARASTEGDSARRVNEERSRATISFDQYFLAYPT